jgi:hypothetical protein
MVLHSIKLGIREDPPMASSMIFPNELPPLSVEIQQLAMFDETVGYINPYSIHIP